MGGFVVVQDPVVAFFAVPVWFPFVAEGFDLEEIWLQMKSPVFTKVMFYTSRSGAYVTRVKGQNRVGELAWFERVV